MVSMVTRLAGRCLCSTESEHLHSWSIFQPCYGIPKMYYIPPQKQPRKHVIINFHQLEPHQRTQLRSSCPQQKTCYIPSFPLSRSNFLLSHEKKPAGYFTLSPGCLIGILIMVYYNLHITGQDFILNKSPKQPG